MMLKKLKLMPDYGCSPLWGILNESFYENISVESEVLQIPKSLKDRLLEWGSVFDRTLNQEYPPDSGFNNELEELEFEKTGVNLWSDLLLEFPDLEICYFSMKDKKLYYKLSELK